MCLKGENLLWLLWRVWWRSWWPCRLTRYAANVLRRRCSPERRRENHWWHRYWACRYLASRGAHRWKRGHSLDEESLHEFEAEDGAGLLRPMRRDVWLRKGVHWKCAWCLIEVGAIKWRGQAFKTSERKCQSKCQRWPLEDETGSQQARERKKGAREVIEWEQGNFWAAKSDREGVPRASEFHCKGS